MSGFVGADVEALRFLGAQLNAQAQELEDLVRRLTVRVESAQWRGPDAQRFRSDWSSRYSAIIRSAALSMRSAADDARSNAAQQESVSGADGLSPALPFPNFFIGQGDDGTPQLMPDPNFSPGLQIPDGPGLLPPPGFNPDPGIDPRPVFRLDPILPDFPRSDVDGGTLTPDQFEFSSGLLDGQPTEKEL